MVGGICRNETTARVRRLRRVYPASVAHFQLGVLLSEMSHHKQRTPIQSHVPYPAWVRYSPDRDVEDSHTIMDRVFEANYAGPPSAAIPPVVLLDDDDVHMQCDLQDDVSESSIDEPLAKASATSLQSVATASPHPAFHPAPLSHTAGVHADEPEETLEMIPKPRGEAGRLNRGGFNLKEALHWAGYNDEQYDEILVRESTSSFISCNTS